MSAPWRKTIPLTPRHRRLQSWPGKPLSSKPGPWPAASGSSPRPTPGPHGIPPTFGTPRRMNGSRPRPNPTGSATSSSSSAPAPGRKFMSRRSRRRGSLSPPTGKGVAFSRGRKSWMWPTSSRGSMSKPIAGQKPCWPDYGPWPDAWALLTSCARPSGSPATTPSSPARSTASNGSPTSKNSSRGSRPANGTRP